ncbi:MAG: glycosyltransferase family 39 protein [Myxococcales bacterium]|nr:glycosyltransferase family 39 protein [Myxococcales bacterium]
MIRLLHVLAAVALLSLVVLPGLGGSGLLDPWEMDRAQVARQIAGNPQILIVDDDKKLLRPLEKATDGLALRRVDARPAQALRVAASQMDDRLTHGLVVDLDAAIGARDLDASWNGAATHLDNITDRNRGALIVLVSKRWSTEIVRDKLAAARARTVQRGLLGGFWKHVMPTDKPGSFAPLFVGSEQITAPDKLAGVLTAGAPSPWFRVQHKVDKRSVQAPLLDTWLVAVSLDLLGASETAARLPGALLAILTGLLLFIAMARLFGLEAAWMAVIVYATLPMMTGSARLVTLAQTGPLGVALTTFGLAQGLSQKARLWPLWIAAGLAILFFGLGLGGLTMGAAICVGYVVVAADWRPGPLLSAVVSAVLLAGCAWWVLGDDQSAFLRSFRFTQMPFGGGIPESHRDFSEIVGMVGFSLYPWGAIFLLAMGRLLVAQAGKSDQPDDAQRTRIVLAMGFGAPLVAVVTLMPEFHQVAVPVAAIVAAVTATLLLDIRQGKAGGPVLTLLIVVPTLLLHREIGKEASTLVRWLAWDPPFGGDSAVYQWPQELKVHRGLRAIVFLSMGAFALGLARPVGWLRRTMTTLQGAAASAWLLGGVALIWLLDVLISMGARADGLSRANATRTGYTYDRIWTTIQTTRPEVIAGAACGVALIAGAALAHPSRRDRAPWSWLAKASGWTASKPVALGLIAALALAQAIAGLWVAAAQMGWGGALVAGLSSAPFIAPLLLAAIAAVLSWLAGRRGAANDPSSPSMVDGVLNALGGSSVMTTAVLVLIALGGLGVGGSQVAGTWSYGYLAATWGFAIALALVVGHRAGTNRAAWALGALSAALVVGSSLFVVLAGRIVWLAPEGARYLARVLLTAPDTALLVGLMVLVIGNHAARTYRWVELARYVGLELTALIERPRIATALPLMAALLMTGGYAFGLLPELSLHFSQKHLLERTGQASQQADGEPPRVFKYAPGGRHTIASNFYTQTMPTLGDRRATLRLLAGRNVATRVSDFGPNGRSLDLAIAGWKDINDKNGDGIRDHKAWFGIAHRTGGKRVQIEAGKEGAGPTAAKSWKPDGWKGATLYNGHGQKARVVSNDKTSLLIDNAVSLVAGDPSRGHFALDTAEPAAVASGKYNAEASAMSREQRFVVVPKDHFSELNFNFRRANKGRHITVVDARSSRLVLTATHLAKGQKDDSWLKKHVLDRKQFDALKGINKTEVNFDNKLYIVGYKLAERSVRRAKKYKLTLYFEVRQGLASSYMIFMHPHPLHRDLWPLAIHPHSKREGKRCTGCFQTNHWLKGDIISVLIEQEVPLGTTAGAHDIIMGLFNPLNDKRLIIKSATGPGVVRHNDNRVTLGKLIVR